MLRVLHIHTTVRIAEGAFRRVSGGREPPPPGSVFGRWQDIITSEYKNLDTPLSVILQLPTLMPNFQFPILQNDDRVWVCNHFGSSSSSHPHLPQVPAFQNHNGQGNLSIPLCSVPSRPTPLRCTPFRSVPFRSVLLCSASIRSVPGIRSTSFCSVPCCSAPLRSVPSFSASFRSVPGIRSTAVLFRSVPLHVFPNKNNNKNKTRQ